MFPVPSTSPLKAADWSYRTIIRARAMALPRRRSPASGKSAYSASTIPEISTVSDRTPVRSITSCAWASDSGDEVRYGIRTARTFSGPSASAARKQVRAESIPPDRPSTTRSIPIRPTSDRIKPVRIFVANSVWIANSPAITVSPSLPR